MLKTIHASTAALAALAAAAPAPAPALAQNGPPASQFAPRVDRPTCTRDELKAAWCAALWTRMPR